MCDTHEADQEGNTLWEPADREQVIERLSIAIQQTQLTVFCGAGLSMGEPSSVPSAAQLTDELLREYRLTTDTDLSERVRNTLEDLSPEEDLKLEHIARWALETNQFTSFFLGTIERTDFFAPTNRGHSAVADFLLTNAVRSAISTNVDWLIERAALDLGQSDFNAVVKRTDINRPRDYADLVKLHGCLKIDREHTVWCDPQLEEDTISARLSDLRQWMEGQLLRSDLLIVGYWSEWPHVRETFVEAIRDIEPPSVYLVDCAEPDMLRSKAPAMAEWVADNEIDFYYLPIRAVPFLDELRERFSRSFCKQLAERTHELMGDFYNDVEVETPFTDPFDELSTEELYGLRRDYAGVPETEPAPDAQPDAAHYDRVGTLHHYLFEKGASFEGRYYSIGGDLYRLVNSQNRSVPRVLGKYEHERPSRGIRAYVCVGGEQIPGRRNVVRYSGEDDVVRVEGSVEWWSDSELREQIETQDE